MKINFRLMGLCLLTGGVAINTACSTDDANSQLLCKTYNRSKVNR